MMLNQHLNLFWGESGYTLAPFYPKTPVHNPFLAPKRPVHNPFLAPKPPFTTFFEKNFSLFSHAAAARPCSQPLFRTRRPLRPLFTTPFPPEGLLKNNLRSIGDRFNFNLKLFLSLFSSLVNPQEAIFSKWSEGAVKNFH